MKFIRIGQNGDYVYQETINGHDIKVRIGVADDKKDARKKAQAAFADLKAKITAGSATITDAGTLILK